MVIENWNELILELGWSAVVMRACSSFSANLPPMPEHYLALLSSISFLVILSKCYLFLY